ncbi:unnamed protein product [Penicillium viridicatum]
MFTPTPTQADDLPPFQPIEIATRNEPSSVWGFKHWLIEVQLALANLNVFAVICHGIQRPTLDHPNYDNWLQWQATILQSFQPHLLLADDIYYRIGSIQFTEEDTMRRAEYSRLWFITRDRFNTLHGYLSAWGAQAIFYAQFDPAFNWFAATQMILGHIKEEMPDLHSLIDHQIRTGGTSCQQFQGHLTGILGALKKRT